MQEKSRNPGSGLWPDTGEQRPGYPSGALPHPGPPQISISLGCISDLPFIEQMQRDDSNALGFLPSQALFQYWKRSRVWVAIDARSREPQPLGYAVTAHNSRRDASQQLIRIQQICTARNHRREGVATALLHRIEDFARTCLYPGVQARVAEPLAANHFWRSLGYLPVWTHDGNNARGRRIVIYRKPLQTKVPLWFVHSREPNA